MALRQLVEAAFFLPFFADFVKYHNRISTKKAKEKNSLAFFNFSAKGEILHDSFS